MSYITEQDLKDLGITNYTKVEKMHNVVLDKHGNHKCVSVFSMKLLSIEQVKEVFKLHRHILFREGQQHQLYYYDKKILVMRWASVDGYKESFGLCWNAYINKGSYK